MLQSPPTPPSELLSTASFAKWMVLWKCLAPTSVQPLATMVHYNSWFKDSHCTSTVICKQNPFHSTQTTENSQITSHFTASASLQLITNVHATLLGVFHILPQLGPCLETPTLQMASTRLQVTDYGSAVQRSWMILIYLNDTLMIWFIWWS
jgi:hypothetical protein